MILTLIFAVGLLAGGVASIAGFGIGSLLTPLVGIETGVKLAVAIVALPHALGTVMRFWLVRHHVNKTVLLGFGIMSAVGGLGGALLHTYFNSPVLSYLLGALLILAGFLGVTGLTNRMRLGRRAAWTAGMLSGAFGGLVGNQGGIRSSAMLALDIPKTEFVATATAIALLVDLARVPVYLATEWSQIWDRWMLVAVAAVAVALGTLAGERMLRKIPETTFRRIVSAIILTVGVLVVAATLTEMLPSG